MQVMISAEINESIACAHPLRSGLIYDSESSHSPFSSLLSKDPKFIPAIMSLDLIYFGTSKQNLTAFHVYFCAVLTRKV